MTTKIRLSKEAIQYIEQALNRNDNLISVSLDTELGYPTGKVSVSILPKYTAKKF